MNEKRVRDVVRVDQVEREDLGKDEEEVAAVLASKFLPTKVRNLSVLLHELLRDKLNCLLVNERELITVQCTKEESKRSCRWTAPQKTEWSTKL